MDLTKLTPAPWETSNKNWRNEDAGHDRYIVGDIHEGDDGGQVATAVAIVKGNETSGTIQDANAAFIALARNAFAIQMAFGWYATRNGDEWLVVIPGVDRVDQGGGFVAADPLTALVEAGKWFHEWIEEHVEAQGDAKGGDAT